MTRDTTATHKLAKFDEFKTLDEPHLKAMKEGAEWLTSAMLRHESPRWLTLLGPSGTGKTYLARMIYRIARNNLMGYEGRDGWPHTRLMRWINWRKFCDLIRGGDYTRTEFVIDPWMAVLDDIGAEYDPSGFLTSKLDRVINERLRKWTVVTCNLSLEEISSKLDRRIASRMIRDGNKVIEVNATDFALRGEG